MGTRTERQAPELKEGAVREDATLPLLRPRRVRSTLGGQGTIRPMGYHWYLPCKAAIDRVLALVFLVPAVPLIALAAVLIKLTSRGPAFYTQTRLGLNGKLFTMWKLRTMIHKAESLTGPRWSLPGDPRITRMGAFLRVTHLDELPQLINVLRGDMSLIGPRPERPEFLPELERAMPGYRRRLAVRPGVTGLAQVQLPPDSDVSSVRRKLAYDLFYVQRISPWLDLRLFCCTLFYALGVPYVKLGRWFRIPRLEEVERVMQPYLGAGPAIRPLRRSA